MLKGYILLILLLSQFVSFAVTEECFSALDSIINYKSDRLIAINKVRSKLKHHIGDLENELFDDPDIEEDLLEIDLFIDSPEQILECPLCTASSISLRGKLLSDPVFKNAKIHLVLTDGEVGDSGYRHFYLRLNDKDIYKEELIVDPTFRQFYLFKLDRQTLSRNIPKIFVGTEQDLRKVFEKFIPAGSDKSSDEWLNTYLKTQIQEVN